MAMFGKATFNADVRATAEAYALAPAGGADECSCVWCRNFRLARGAAYPPAFVAFLAELGIDANKEGEVWSGGSQKPGHHSYGGWFHFVGQLDGEEEASQTIAFGPSLEATLRRAHAPTILSLPHAKMVAIDFFTRDVPWMLDEVDPA